MFNRETLGQDPNPLAAHYTRFRVSERLLLTGHSHQAWPDCAQDGLLRSLEDAATWVDDKWGNAFQQVEELQDNLRWRLEDPQGVYCFAQSTHDLLVRWLSALPLRTRPRIVTTDSEFHSMRRQLRRLAEEGVEVVQVPAEPMDGLSQRLVDAIDERTAALMVSAVFFNSGRIATGLQDLVEPCAQQGVELLVDTYHAAGVLPFSVTAEGLGDAYLVGGGYKYLQWGEGVCFLRIPQSCNLRPVVTGWFADFAGLEGPQTGRIQYGDGAARFAGATYDPASHYRAVEVSRFFRQQGLTPHLLRQVNQDQLGILVEAFDALDLDPAVVTRDRNAPLSSLSGFLTLRAPEASRWVKALRERSIWVDSREDRLRFGPAPYLTPRQLCDAMAGLGECIRGASSL